MARKQAFTPAAIEALRAGKLNDPDNDGLYIEALPSGKRVWKLRHRIAGAAKVYNARLGLYPAHSIGAAREWARPLIDLCKAGTDPEAKAEADEAEALFTVDYCHSIYMDAVRRNEHKPARSQKAARPLKDRTIADKKGLYDRNVKDALGNRSLASITEEDLTAVVVAMGARGARIQANRLGQELNVFFKFCRSLRGRAHGIKLETNPASVLGELWHPEQKRDRWLDEAELPLFLRALALEGRLYQRALLLMLLTGTRFHEILSAPVRELQSGVWIIPSNRTKNSEEHPIKLGPWGLSLFAETQSEWVIPSGRCDGPQINGWPKVLERIRKNMEKIGDTTVAHFTPHDLRRTASSWWSDMGLDDALVERMLNHKLVGLKERYIRSKRASAMAVGFAQWERHLASMARKAGVARALSVVTKADGSQSTVPPQS